MARQSDLAAAFDLAIDQVQRAIAAGMVTISGEPARAQLESLRQNLEAERPKAIERGKVNLDWFQTTLRWVVEWAPETDLTLIAALGKIARVPPRSVS
ncbi:MAG: hypothetical protein ABR585_10770 [Gemmatimonadaceae bacterium]